MLRIRDIMTRNVLTATPDMSLREAMALLCEHHVSGAPVVDGGKVVGVFSATDLLTYLSDLTDGPASLTTHRKGRRATPLEDVTVADVMTRKVEAMPPECTVEQAAALMGEKKIHRLLVMMGDVLLGIVSMSDVAHAVAGELLRTRTYVFSRG